jgi:2'-5' RNA ligase
LIRAFIAATLAPAIVEEIAKIHSALQEAQGDIRWTRIEGAHRVVWMGLKGEGLSALSESIETALAPLDFPPEDRPFTPHLTLGRVRSLRGWEQVLAVVKAYEHVRFGESRIGEITLYQSELRPEGAVYRPLGSVPLRPS